MNLSTAVFIFALILLSALGVWGCIRMLRVSLDLSEDAPENLTTVRVSRQRRAPPARRRRLAR
jgi:hypothetical protein